jgi:hypothetical protein
MTGVVLRCPNCGTTKAGPGECEACHDADVRYFCTNHMPGHWLDSAHCPECGARFGEHTPPMSNPSEPPPERPAPRPEPWTPDRVTPMSGKAFPRRREPGEPALPERIPASLPELLRRARLRTRPVETMEGPDPATVGLALGGCFARGIVMVIVLLMLMFFSLFFLGGSMLQGFGVFIF